MIEMVIVTPFLLLMMMAAAEFGKALIEYNALNKQVREGARLVAGQALLGTTGTVQISPDIEADVRNLVVFGNIAGSGQPRLNSLAPGQVSVSDAGNNLIEVRADYPYQSITGPVFTTFGYGSGPSLNLTLTATVRMRAL